MARIYGLNGLIRGRQGNNVFSVQNGTQVLKVYNPVVANPRSLPQRTQRAKFALAGKMSSIVPNLAISGMSGSNSRGKRARFVQSLVNIATVSGTVDALVASVPFNSIKWSEGSISRWSQTFTATATYTSNLIQVDSPAMSLRNNPPLGYGELLVVALFDSEGRQLDEVQTAFRSTTTANTFYFRETPTRQEVVVAVYICPFTTDSSLNRGVSSNLYYTGETSVNVRMSTSSSLAGYNWGDSQPIQVFSVAPVTTSVNPSPDDDRQIEDSRSSSKKK